MIMIVLFIPWHMAVNISFTFSPNAEKLVLKLNSGLEAQLAIDFSSTELPTDMVTTETPCDFTFSN